MHAPLLIVGVFCIGLLGGCRCTDPAKVERNVDRPSSKAAGAVQPLKTSLSSADQRRMREIIFFTKEARRRVTSDTASNMKDIATMIGLTAGQIELNRATPSFVSYMQRLRQRAKTLAGSKHPRKDYSAMLDACISCHTDHAPSILARVKRLRLK